MSDSKQTVNKAAQIQPISSDNYKVFENYLKQDDQGDIEFGKKDLEAFEIPDLKTRISALKNVFYLRLENLLMDAAALIYVIYGVNPLKKMSIVRDPDKLIEARNNQPIEDVSIGFGIQKLDFRIAKRNNRPFKESRSVPPGKGQDFRGLSVNERKIVTLVYHPSVLSIEIDNSGLIKVLLNPFIGIEDKKYRTKIADSLLVNKTLLEKIFNHAEIKLISYDKQYHINTLVSFTEFAKNLLDGDGEFSTTDRYLPINWDTGIYELLNAIIALYPLLEAFTAVADGFPDNQGDHLRHMLLKYINYMEQFYRKVSDKSGAEKNKE
jgi:hypothetical protein